MVLCASATQVRFRRASAAIAQLPEIAEIVRRTLDVPDEQLDYARAKIAFDRLVDPSLDEQWVFAELDRLTDAARGLASPDAVDAARLSADRDLRERSMERRKTVRLRS